MSRVGRFNVLLPSCEILTRGKTGFEMEIGFGKVGEHPRDVDVATCERRIENGRARIIVRCTTCVAAIRLRIYFDEHAEELRIGAEQCGIQIYWFEVWRFVGWCTLTRGVN